MIENPYYSQQGHGPYELHNIGDLELEEGGTLCDCQLAMATHGKLNAAKDNTILVPTWYSGTSKIIEQVYVGKGRALDPSKYFHHRRQPDRQRSVDVTGTRRHPTGWRTSRPGRRVLTVISRAPDADQTHSIALARRIERT